MDSVKSLGSAIKLAREAAGLTQDGLSDKAGLAYSTLAKIEQGAIKNPSIFTVAAIAKALGVQIEELLSKPAKTNSRSAKQQEIKFIYCDVNGVMVRFYHHAFISLSEETGVSFDLVKSTFWHYNDVVCRGEMSIEDLNKAMAQRLGVKKVGWERHYMGSIQPVKEMQNLLGQLMGTYKIGLLTNIMPGFLEKMWENGLLPKLKFSAVIDSSKVGAVKPDYRIYKEAEKAAHHRGEDILLIDDSRTNLTVAEQFNWQVFWFDDYDPAESIKRINQILVKH